MDVNGGLSGVDETCAGDIANVADGRGLSFGDRAWLARAVTGAVRPNRDKPFWDLAHLLGALARAGTGGDAFDLLLDPALARPDAACRALLEAGVATDGHGPKFEVGDRVWRSGWSATARLLALAEFMLTAEELAHFAEIRGWLTELGHSPQRDDIDQLSRRLVRLANAYRDAHLPIAPVEKRFRSILSYLGARPQGGAAFDDDDILSCWRSEVGQGERTQFRTVAEHFVTFERALASFGGMTSLVQAGSVEAIEGWTDRLDAALGDLVGDREETAPLAARLKALPDAPKILTGAERDDIADIVALEPFHRDRPLTVLRSISFGRVQSGIANRLRRGTGGPDVAERAACGEAEAYATAATRAETLKGHLDRMVKIAAALRLSQGGSDDPRVAALIEAAEADLKRVRRAGFDADRDTLTEGFAAADETLVDARAALEAFAASVAALGKRAPLDDAFEADRAAFAETFHIAYVARDAAA